MHKEVIENERRCVVRIDRSIQAEEYFRNYESNRWYQNCQWYSFQSKLEVLLVAIGHIYIISEKEAKETEL